MIVAPGEASASVASTELVVLMEILLLVGEVSSNESVSTASRVKLAF